MYKSKDGEVRIGLVVKSKEMNPETDPMVVLLYDKNSEEDKKITSEHKLNKAPIGISFPSLHAEGKFDCAPFKIDEIDTLIDELIKYRNEAMYRKLKEHSNLSDKEFDDLIFNLALNAESGNESV